MKLTATTLGLAAGLVMTLGIALAAQAPASDQGVARLSLVEGAVSTQHGAGAAWTDGAINSPLLAGDTITSSAGARIEITLDFADLLRLNSSSQAAITTLTAANLQVNLSQGLADFVALDGAEATSEIDTPNVAVHPHGAGVFRIQVNGSDETVVTARSGDAEISTSAGSTTLRAGQSITVAGTDDPQYQIADAAPRDGWDDWNQQRDSHIETAQSWSHANRYYTGVNDLDAYGRWVNVPGYGGVWQPAVAYGWSPYSAGSWVYEPYWGWTWVSTEAWGWAPYHYGRWFYYDTGWVWWPGPVMITPRFRPIWAPAYVSFFGLHGGVGVGVGFGSVAWVAIGPGDVYHPWFGPRVGIGVRVIEPLAPLSVRVRYSNLALMRTDVHVRAAVVSVGAARFGHGPIVRERVSVEDLRTATAMRGRLTMEHPEIAERARAGVRDPAAPATRPGFQRFGGGARPAEHPATSPATRGPAPAEHTTAPARGNTHANDSSWHKFQPDAKKEKPDKSKSGARRGGGGGA